MLRPNRALSVDEELAADVADEMMREAEADLEDTAGAAWGHQPYREMYYPQEYHLLVDEVVSLPEPINQGQPFHARVLLPYPTRQPGYEVTFGAYWKSSKRPHSLLAKLDPELARRETMAVLMLTFPVPVVPGDGPRDILQKYREDRRGYDEQARRNVLHELVHASDPSLWTSVRPTIPKEQLRGGTIPYARSVHERKASQLTLFQVMKQVARDSGGYLTQGDVVRLVKENYDGDMWWMLTEAQQRRALRDAVLYLEDAGIEVRPGSARELYVSRPEERYARRTHHLTSEDRRLLAASPEVRAMFEMQSERARRIRALGRR